MMVPMRRCLRGLLGLVAAACVMGVLAWPSFRASLVVRRECYRAAELVGIMNPSGDLGGQVAGFNYQRHPAWVHPVAEFIAGSIAFAVRR